MSNESDSNESFAEVSKASGPTVKVGNPDINGATPTDGTVTLYQGQKIALAVNTTDLNTTGYTQIKFELLKNADLTVLDNTKAGLIVHPDSTGQTTQTITAADDYTIKAIVNGAQSTQRLYYCRWNVEVTGASLDPLALKGTHLQNGDYGYGTNKISVGPLFSMRRIPGGTSTFDAAAAFKIDNYQVSDGAPTPAPIAKTFSARIIGTKGNLDYFDFWDAGQAKLPKIQVNGHDSHVWIDSGPDGKFNFYVTSNVADDMYVDTLRMMVGNQSPDIAMVIAGNTGDAVVNASLPAPMPNNAVGSNLSLGDHDSFVVASIPTLNDASAVQQGDLLIPLVNDVPLVDSFFVANDDGVGAGFPNCFSIPVAALTTGTNGDLYKLSYMVVRGTEVAISCDASYHVSGTGQSGNLGPFPSSGAQYNAPTMSKNPAQLDIDFNMVADGFPVRISWDSSKWAPDLGTVLTLQLIFNGWNSSGAVNTIRNVAFPAIVQADLDAKYQEVPVDYKYFAGFIKSGDKQSTVCLQYIVPPVGSPQKPQAYSTPTNVMNINTVPPGGL